MKITAVVAVLCALVYGALAYGQPKPSTGFLAEFDAIPIKPGAQRPGRYTIAASTDGRTAWRIDTATGAASYCLVGLKTTSPLANPDDARSESCSAWMR